jgi:hypothetical protein
LSCSRMTRSSDRRPLGSSRRGRSRRPPARRKSSGTRSFCVFPLGSLPGNQPPPQRRPNLRRADQILALLSRRVPLTSPLDARWRSRFTTTIVVVAGAACEAEHVQDHEHRIAHDSGDVEKPDRAVACPKGPCGERKTLGRPAIPPRGNGLRQIGEREAHTWDRRTDA